MKTATLTKLKLFFAYLLISASLCGCSNPTNKMPPLNPFAAMLSHEQETSFSNNAPSHIALLLPLEGKLDSTSQAFRDGFFDAYYADKKSHASSTKISIIDTKNDTAILASYKAAIDKGANFIVGPLTKEGVHTLSTSNLVTVPTLALNKIAQNTITEKMYFYSLAPEDEAIQMAKQAQHQGNHTALVIAEKSDWGERTANAFVKNWQQLGGQIVEVIYFNRHEKADAFTKKAFQVKEYGKDSEGKAMSQTKRHDMDMIFLITRPEDTRQIRPFISFYYHENLPVFTTSNIYTEASNSNKTMNRDINGVIFCDMPWILEPNSINSSLRNGLEEMWSHASLDFSRLYAMGSDAYAIAKQINKTHSFSRFSYKGTTGYLTLGANHQIQRELICARLENGRAQVLR